MYISKLKEPKQYPTIFFGRYTIPNSVKPFEIHISQPIEWLVLDYNHKVKKALIVSKYAIDSEGFANCPILGCGYETSWEKSYLRLWLNGDFFEDSFDSEEKSKILSSYTFSFDGIRKRTIDKIFLLSLNEVKKYFFTKNSAATVIPMVDDFDVNADEEHPITVNNYPVSWWTRTLSNKKYLVKVVGPDGKIYDLDSNCDETGVRPAMWIKM